ncbi:MAG TPA: hypothetical protein VLH75_00795 [Longimicrobiales bacterium]|nr:hypothetical protein [Longimicrobiales bacterium]
MNKDTGLRFVRSVVVPSSTDDQTLSAIGAELLGELQGGERGDVFGLDVSKVRLRASQLALVLKAPLLHIADRNPHSKKQAPHLTYLVGIDPSAGSGWDADAALKTMSEERVRGFAMPWRSEEGTTIVGRVDKLVADTYAFVLGQANGATTAGLVASARKQREPIRMQAASNRLSRTAGAGLIHAARREPNKGGGGHWVYLAVR